ncbi:MAG TPA: aldehyde dehydrogenase family protein [Acidimicrobiia bacterium]|nr:aldehyde dehydrogenase family protein [Acidimicrobiia bacterium]
MTTIAKVFIGGVWRVSDAVGTFETLAPATGEPVGTYPTSTWGEVDTVLEAGYEAYRRLRDIDPASIAAFLTAYADRIEAGSAELAETAAIETGLAASPRFTDVEIPRTVNQLRLAAEAAVARTWVEPVISPEAGIASWMAPAPGVVAVFGPNNFPFAFNGVSGGDFAAAIATRHPVVAKANPGHPETTRLLALAAAEALEETGLPMATVQLIYRTSHADGERLVADPRLAATAYTGSRSAGLALKARADAAGKPIYLEMSSVNPVVVLSGALNERGDAIAEALVGSILLGAGQFCTSPGLIVVADSPAARAFVDAMRNGISNAPSATLLGDGVASGLAHAKERWVAAGASVVAVGSGGGATSYPATLLTVGADQFIDRHLDLQTEAFGSMALVVMADGSDEMLACIDALEGNLTGTIFASSAGADDEDYVTVAAALREKVGRLLNDKVPTGVAVVSAMNHGGPYPATGHPGFTAVGIPASLRRFAMLQCFDNVADGRLPDELKAANPLGLTRMVDTEWTTDRFTWGEARG